MKKVLLFVLAAIFACYTTNAQVLLNEGFENGIPNTWTTIDNDGDGNNWTLGSVLMGEWGDDASDYANNGADFAMSASYDNVNGGAWNADNYLVTPQIAIPANGATLSFVIGSCASRYLDSYAVKLSTTGNAVANFTVTLQALAQADAGWNDVEIDLSAYAGQSVYIAFQHQCSDMLGLWLDDVKVYSFTNTPEITLNSVSLPSYSYAGEGFDVSGVVLNVSQNALTSFNVTYNVDGGAESASYTVSGINVAAGETYEFTHNVQAVIAAGGSHTVNVTVSNPNGTADNTADNTNSGTITIYDCTGGITEFTYTQDFEEGVVASCWSTPENEFSAWGNAYNYIQTYGPNSFYGLPFEAHTGDNSLISAADTNIAVDWLISPAITIPNDAPAVGFKYFDYLSYDPDDAGSTSYSVLVSTTGNDEADFTTTLNTFTVTENAFTERTINLAAYAGQTIYVAFKHTTTAWLILDDFSIEVASSDPEIALTSVNVPSMVSTGEQFNIGGVITNNSGVALTSFKVQYTINGTTSDVYTVSGVNVGYSESYTFTHNAPASIAEAGNYTVSVTVSEPNGTADNTADNTLTASVAVCGVVSTLPYTEGFEGGLGCWTAISNNTENEDVDDDGFGVVSDFSFGAHGGNSCFIFSSFNETEGDYTQYLISPEFNLTDACTMTFYYTQRSNTYAESCIVMVSTTTNDPASFTQIGEEVVADQIAGTWTEATFNIPANTKYIAFKYTSEYQWFMAIDDITLNAGSAPVTYTITVVSDNTTMGTVSGGGSFAEGATTTISATANNGYRFVRWNDNNTDNPRTITVTGTATYTAFFESTSTPDPQGIDEVNANNVKLYPNPTTGNLYVEVEGLQKVEVIDAVGRVVLSQNNGTVNMSAFANGVYTVRVSANGATSIKKVVKK